MKKNIIIAVLVIGFLAFVQHSCQREKNRAQILSGLEDNITTYRNHLNQEVAEKNVIISSNRSQLLEIRELTGTNLRLQKLVKDQKQIIAGMSSDHTTTIKYVTDTVKIIGAKGELPIYQSEFADKWKTGSVTMGPDSLSLDLKVFNKFDWSFHREKYWFRPDTLKIQLISLNPHTQTDDMSAFSLADQKKRFSLGPSIGLGLGAGLGLQFQVGISFQYSLLQL